jgi:hypothetical protein
VEELVDGEREDERDEEHYPLEERGLIQRDLEGKPGV